MTVTEKKPRKKKARKLTTAQRAAFQSPINPPKDHKVIPHHHRMGVKANGY